MVKCIWDEVWTNLPDWNCPKCRRENYHDEYYLKESGDSLLCGGCETEFVIEKIAQAWSCVLEEKEVTTNGPKN